jgi:hypothetical protein
VPGRLWFKHGAYLPDSDQLLQGGGRGRYIAIASANGVPAETLARYVTKATAQRLIGC